MFLLRRTAVRAISSSSSIAISAKPRSIATITPTAFRTRQQQCLLSSFQRRFASDDAAKREDAAGTPESFAQTAAEAPVDENVTPAQPADTAAEPSNAASSFRIRNNKTEDTRPQDTEPAAPNKTLYVGNLFYEVTEEQLERIFSRFGEVKSTRVLVDSRGLSRGFGYVEFDSVNDAQTAIENLDMQVFEGRNLVVQFHRPTDKKRIDGIRRAPRPTEPTKTLFIGNMAYEMSDKDLNDLFRDVRNVVDVRVAIDRRTGQPRGFAHADFIDAASAAEAKEKLSQQVLYGRKLRVDYTSTGTFSAKERALGPS